jgi:hypothetical protein
MTTTLRLLAAGSLQTEQLALRVVSGADEAFHAGHAIDEALRAAAEHGAALFAIDVAADPYAEYHDADEITEVFGTPMTYREYWQIYPDEQVARPTPDWRPRVLLRVDTPALSLITPDGSSAVLAERWGDLGRPHPDDPQALFVALMPDEPPAAGEPAADPPGPALRPGSISPIGGAAQALAWQLGPAATLRPADLAVVGQRDWSWAWPRTIGPVYLNIYLGASAAQIHTWLMGVACRSYRCYDELLVRSELPLRLTDVYQPLGLHALQLQSERFTLGMIICADGLLSLSRSYHTPGEPHQSADASILAALLDSDLGELSWDLLDGDYVNFHATGDSRESLRRYLNPQQDAQPLRDAWRLALRPHTADALAAAQWSEVAAAIAQQLGAPAIGDDPAAELVAWIAQTPIRALPRRVEVSIRQSVYDASQEARERLQHASPRILWVWALRV